MITLKGENIYLRALEPNDLEFVYAMENDQSIERIVAAGFDPVVVERVTRLIKINEYKRRQAPVGIRVTHRSFGKDWRYPITSKFCAWKALVAPYQR